MSGWSTRSLGDATLAWAELDGVERLFRSEYGKAGCPEDMAVFVRLESDGRLHCEVKVYFSPAAAAVAREADAEPCERPAPDGLSLLAGGERAWALLCPDPRRDAGPPRDPATRPPF